MPFRRRSPLPAGAAGADAAGADAAGADAVSPLLLLAVDGTRLVLGDAAAGDPAAGGAGAAGGTTVERPFRNGRNVAALPGCTMLGRACNSRKYFCQSGDTWVGSA